MMLTMGRRTASLVQPTRQPKTLAPPTWILAGVEASLAVMPIMVPIGVLCGIAVDCCAAENAQAPHRATDAQPGSRWLPGLVAWVTVVVPTV
jgi:hypothetical protein